MSFRGRIRGVFFGAIILLFLISPVISDQNIPTVPGGYVLKTHIGQNETDQESSYVPGQVLVKFDPALTGKSVSAASLAVSANEAIGAVTTRDYSSYGLTGLALISLRQGMSVDEAISYYSSVPGVAYAEPDRIAYLQKTPDDPDLWRQWGISNNGQVYRENTTPGRVGTDIHALSAWDRTTGSSSATVAILDTGVDVNHPDLEKNLWIDPVTGLHGLNLIQDETKEVWDDFGHGTHCAGIIGMVGNNGIGGSGVNWNTSIASIKILNSVGSGRTSDIILGILYASARGFRVISCSFGYPYPSGYSNATYEAIRSSSSLFVISAGNDQLNNDLYPVYPACYNLSNIIAVAATDSHDTLAWFSNYGSKSVHIAAPGQDIFSTFPSVYTYDPIWSDMAANFSQWNVTGNISIDPSSGYPNPPSFLINQPSNDDEPIILETKEPVNFTNAKPNPVLYLNYKVQSDTPNVSTVIEIYASGGRTNWSRLDTIMLHANAGWKQGFTLLPEGQVLTNYKLVITPYSPDSSVQVNIGSIGIGSRKEVREPGFTYMSGTSMATPAVAGIAAMIKGTSSNLSAQEIKQIIMDSADTIPNLQGKIRNGGRANLSAALDRIAPVESIPVFQGWNFVSVPKKLAEGHDSARIFTGINATGHSILTFHDNLTGWKVLNENDTVLPLEGYWIYSINQTIVPVKYATTPDISSRSVSPGWNGIGGWYDQDRSANLTFSSLGTGWSYVVGYDGNRQQYEEIIIRGGTGNQSDNRPINPGKGYWLYTPVNGTYQGGIL